MSIDTIAAWCIFAGFIPFLAIIFILIHYFLRRFLWRRRKRLGKSSLGFYPTSFALGMALQFMQVYWKPSIDYVLQERQREEADEDDDGDPEDQKTQLDRQLKKIRRGEPVDHLVLRI
jgi:F0F1-type ATP synthase membrane subunit b/b'